MREYLKNALIAYTIRRECRMRGVEIKGIPWSAFWEVGKWLRQQLNFYKYADAAPKEKREGALALLDEAAAAVEGFLSPTPEKKIVNQWLRQDKDDFTYQVLAILQRCGIPSPWARRS